MPIRLTPEDEKLIEERLRSGAFRNAGEVIHDALASQPAEADWFVENRESINERIARGIEQLDRGEGGPGDVARAAMLRIS